MFLSLDTVKTHLNIDACYHGDDEYLQHLILVAEKVVEKHIDCDFSVLQDEVGMIPSPLLQAMLLFIGDMYQSRESVSFASAQELPLSFRYLLDLYTDYSCDECIKPDSKVRTCAPCIVSDLDLELPKVPENETLDQMINRYEKELGIKDKKHHKEDDFYEPLEPMSSPKEHHHKYDHIDEDEEEFFINSSIEVKNIEVIEDESRTSD